MLQAEIGSHYILDLLEYYASDLSGYITLSCASPKPSTDRPTVSPGLTNLVATMLPVMTIISWVRLLPRWASMLTNQSKASNGCPMTSHPYPSPTTVPLMTITPCAAARSIVRQSLSGEPKTIPAFQALSAIRVRTCAASCV